MTFITVAVATLAAGCDGFRILQVGDPIDPGSGGLGALDSSPGLRRTGSFGMPAQRRYVTPYQREYSGD